MRASIGRRASGALAILTTAVLLAACAPASSAPAEAPISPPSSAKAAGATDTEREPEASESSAPAPSVATVSPPTADSCDEAPAAGSPCEGPVDDAPSLPSAEADGSPRDAESPHDEQDAAPGDAADDSPAVVLPVGPGPFETRNGSATFTVPEGWSGVDESYVGVGTEPGDAWVNVIELERDGVRVQYVDTLQVGFLTSFEPGDWGAVDARPVSGSLVAQSYWSVDGGRYEPHVALTHVSQRAAHGFPAGTVSTPVFATEGENSYRFEADLSSAAGYRAFATEAEVVAFLQSPAVTAALELIASVELTGVDGHALP